MWESSPLTCVLIDEDLMGRQCGCNCHPINRQNLQLPLVSLDCARNHDDVENEYYWRNTCGCLNCTLHGAQTEDRSKIFNFDPDAIQVMEDMEIQQLPEAVNREIVKNSQEIVFEKMEGDLQKNIIKLHGKRYKTVNYDQQIISENDEEDQMKKALERNFINKEMEENNQESVFEEEEGDVLMPMDLIRLSKGKGKISRSNQKIAFEEQKEDFLKRNMIGSNEKKAEFVKNSREIISEERNLIRSNEKNIDTLKSSEEIIFKEEEGALEKVVVKLDERKDDILKNTQHIYEEEELALVKVEENGEDIRRQISHTPYEPEKEYKTRNNEFARKNYEVYLEKKQRMHDRRYQLIAMVNPNQNNLEKTCFLNENKKFEKEFDRSLSDDSFAANDRKSFGKSGRRSIHQLILPVNQDQRNSKKNIFLNERQTSSRKFNRSLFDIPFRENDRRSFGKFEKNMNQLIVPVNRNQRSLRSDFFPSEKQNSSKKLNRSISDYCFMIDDRKSFRESKENTMKNTKNVEILEEDRKSSREIRQHSVASLDHSSPIFHGRLNYHLLKCGNDNQQVERGCNIRNENKKVLKKSRCLAKIAIQHKFHPNDIHSPVSEPESGFCEGIESSCRESRLFTRNMLKDEILGRNNSSSSESNLLQKNVIDDVDSKEKCAKDHVASIRDVDTNKASSHSNSLYKNFTNDENNPMKCADASVTGEQIICMDYEMDVHEAKRKYKYPSISSRKLISNVDDPEESSLIAENQFVCRKSNLRNVDEVLAKQKNSFLNTDASYKHVVKDINCLEQFDNAIVAEEKIDHDDIKVKDQRNFSDNNISYDNLINDVVALHHSEQYNSSFAEEQAVYSNELEDRKQAQDPSNLSCENLVRSQLSRLV